MAINDKQENIAEKENKSMLKAHVTLTSYGIPVAEEAVDEKILPDASSMEGENKISNCDSRDRIKYMIVNLPPKQSREACQISHFIIKKPQFLQASNIRGAKGKNHKLGA